MTKEWDSFKADIRSSFSTLQSILNILNSLKKYESSFSADAKEVLQTTINSIAGTCSALGSARLGDDLASYLCADEVQSCAKSGQEDASSHLSKILSGGVPIHRVWKDELATASGILQELNFDLGDKHTKTCVRLRKLVSEVNVQSSALDSLESRLDDIMRGVLQDVFGATSLSQDMLQPELSSLQGAIATCASPGASSSSATYLSLALNSLQRMHAHLLRDESEDSEEEATTHAPPAADDDSEEDLFNIPLPSAVKMADSGKYFMLAQPISEQPEKDFVILVDRDSGQEEEEYEHIELDGDAITGVPESMLSAMSPQPSTSEVASPPVSPKPATPTIDIPVTPPTPGMATSPGPASPSTPVPAPSLTDEDSALVPATSLTAPEGTTPGGDDKMHQFMSFLTGANPGACMFHAQMKLSPEGCWKLANFLKSSARVRALSLSHNYLGDAGLAIICEGLRCSPAITALDLPDNDLSDVGVKVLVEALASNTSLTQLQLAYNRIGDEGAAELAKVIASSTSLKKLGLAYNNITKPGCQALIAAINKNQSLKQLQLLPGNPVEERDAKVLARALKRNKKFSIKTFLGLRE